MGHECVDLWKEGILFWYLVSTTVEGMAPESSKKRDTISLSRLRIYKIEDSEVATSRAGGTFTKKIPEDANIKALSFNGINYSLVCIEYDNHSKNAVKVFQMKKSGDKVN
jgi:hypothetical protein